MHPAALRKLLHDVAAGATGVDDALRRLETLPFEDLGFARIDHHRALRCGFPEVILGEGKTPGQIEQIFRRLAERGAVLATRVAPQAATQVRKRLPAAQYDPLSRTLTLKACPKEPQEKIVQSRSNGAAGPAIENGKSKIENTFVAIVCAGTGDLSVAEEARITAEMLGAPTQCFYDIGVAGIHRLLSQSEKLRQAAALVVAAGMEGALPSVVSGLVAAPVIAVPTSVGYGASLGGIAALLAMLNSCASGVSVVNIDNGFGAGYQAAMIWRLSQGMEQPLGRAQPADAARTKPVGRAQPADAARTKLVGRAQPAKRAPDEPPPDDSARNRTRRSNHQPAGRARPAR